MADAAFAPLIVAVAALIEFGGAIIVTAAVLRALLALIGAGGIDRARRLVIAGSLGGLGFKSAASLLKALELGTWHAIGAFAAIYSLRTAIKRLFLWEQSRLAVAR